MALYLEILNGNQEGMRYPAVAGATIGRRSSQIILRDSKVSGRHAKIEQRSDGKLYLIDLSSANGIKVGESRVIEFELSVGAKFSIGRSQILVVELSEAEAAAEMPEIVVEPEKPLHWKQILSSLAMRAIEEAKPVGRSLSKVYPALLLRFVRGVQSGQEWVIGYGPREIGPGSIDLVLQDPLLPKSCFKILPSPEGAIIDVESGVEVKLNGKSIRSSLLRSGDLIEIKTTQITVAYEVIPTEVMQENTNE